MAYNNSNSLPKSNAQEEENHNRLEPTPKANSTSLEQNEVRNKPVGLTKAQELINGVLRFLSTASSETLGACAVGLASITYFVLGRVGLLIIGIVGGVLLHATWEENVQNQASHGTEASEARRRKEASLNVVERVLNWRGKQHGNSTQDRSDVRDVENKISAHKELDFSGFQPFTAAALGNLTDAVIRDYVKYGSDESICWQYADP